jgi:ribosome modulation factor
MQESQWCLVGNIVEERSYGAGVEEKRRGTKHFSPGTKVYCLPPHWGDGYEKILVIGRHRGSKQFKTMVVRSSWINNWRAKLVYNPEVLRRISEMGTRKWESKEEIEISAKSISEWQAK